MDYQEAREELILKGVSQKLVRLFEKIAIHYGLRGPLTDRECFERSFERPSNFFELPSEEQWEIDKKLGILDMDTAHADLSDEDVARCRAHYKTKKPPEPATD